MRLCFSQNVFVFARRCCEEVGKGEKYEKEKERTLVYYDLLREIQKSVPFYPSGYRCSYLPSWPTSRRQKTTDCSTFELAARTRSPLKVLTLAFWVVHAITKYEVASPLATVQVSATLKLAACYFVYTEKANDAAEHAGKRIS